MEAESFEPSPEDEAFATQAFRRREPTVEEPRAKRNGNGTNGHAQRASLRDRTLPQSADAEMAVLGCMLIAPNQVIPECVERIRPEHLHIPAHATIYAILLDLFDAQKPIDFITLTQILHDRKLLEVVGGAGFVTGLYTFVPTTANIRYYLDIVREKYRLRCVIAECTQIVARAYDDQDEPEEIIGDAHGKITALALDDQARKQTIHDVVLETIALYQIRRDGAEPQVRTGIQKLDDESPARAGDFILLSGLRKAGKSALIGQIVKHVCMEDKQAGAVFTLEMPSYQWIERMAANMGRLQLKTLRKAALGADDWETFNRVCREIAASKLMVFDDVNDLTNITARLRQFKARNPECLFAVVDYAQLVEVPERKGTNREQEVARVARTFRKLAKELKIVVFILSQLNERGEARESRALEHECTAHWKVLQDLNEHGQPKKNSKNQRTIWIPYQRNGEEDIRVQMKFYGAQARFEQDEDQNGGQEDLPLESHEPRRSKYEK